MEPINPPRLPQFARLASLDSTSPIGANLPASGVRLAPSNFITGPPLVPCVILEPISASRGRPDASSASRDFSRLPSMPPPARFAQRDLSPIRPVPPSAPLAPLGTSRRGWAPTLAAVPAERAPTPQGQAAPTPPSPASPAPPEPTPTTLDRPLAGPADVGITPPPQGSRVLPTVPCFPPPSPSAATLQ